MRDDNNSSKKVSQMFGDELLSISTRLIAINQVVVVVVVAANESLAGDRRGGRERKGRKGAH